MGCDPEEKISGDTPSGLFVFLSFVQAASVFVKCDIFFMNFVGLVCWVLVSRRMENIETKRNLHCNQPFELEVGVATIGLRRCRVSEQHQRDARPWWDSSVGMC